MKKRNTVFDFADFESAFASIQLAEAEEGLESEDDFEAYKKENAGKVVNHE